MATGFALLVAFILSLLAGTMVVQAIAEWTRGNEVYILAFGWVVVVAFAAILAFTVTLVASRSAAAVDRVAFMLSCLAALLAIGLAGWSLSSGGMATLGKDAPLIACVTLSALAVLVVQWWLVRRRAVRRVGALP